MWKNQHAKLWKPHSIWAILTILGDHHIHRNLADALGWEVFRVWDFDMLVSQSTNLPDRLVDEERGSETVWVECKAVVDKSSAEPEVIVDQGLGAQVPAPGGTTNMYYLSDKRRYLCRFLMSSLRPFFLTLKSTRMIQFYWASALNRKRFKFLNKYNPHSRILWYLMHRSHLLKGHHRHFLYRNNTAVLYQFTHIKAKKEHLLMFLSRAFFWNFYYLHFTITNTFPWRFYVFLHKFLQQLLGKLKLFFLNLWWVIFKLVVSNV